jgi:hypothetical protein
MSPKGGQRRLAEHLVDRSHRAVVRKRRSPPWTSGQKALLVMTLASIFPASAPASLARLSPGPLRGVEQIRE